VAVETQIVAGQPGAALLELADAEDVDLVVVGRRGRGLSRAVLGSAAAALTTGARCPVLLAGPSRAGT
jgi:nucleotide-binding universal stress UspA family protein